MGCLYPPPGDLPNPASQADFLLSRFTEDEEPVKVKYFRICLNVFQIHFLNNMIALAL